MRTFDIPKLLEENKDYEMVPGDGENWDIRILEGEFTETLIRFGQLKVADYEAHLTFNFDILSSPDTDLTDENVKLQEYVGDVLYSILDSAITTDNRKT